MVMTNTTKYGDLSHPQAAYASVTFIERAQATLIMDRFAETRELPTNESNTITFTKNEALLKARAPLADGVIPSGQKLQRTLITCVCEEWGDVVQFTNRVVDFALKGTWEDTLKNAAEIAAESKELNHLNVLKSGSNVYYAGSGVTSRTSVNGTITRSLQRDVVRTLSRFRAKEITEINSPTPMIATDPIERAFIGVAHPDLESDIRNMKGFIDTAHYSNPSKAFPGEIGKCEKVRYILTDLLESWQAAATSTSSTTWLSGGAVPSTNSAADVYPVLIFGAKAYGTVSMTGKSAVQIAAVKPDKIDHGNPLGQNGFISYKFYDACVILTQGWLVRVEVNCSASSAE